MESINKVELQGFLGTIKAQKIGDAVLARFTVATQASFKSPSQGVILETTWHSVEAWGGKGMPDFSKMKQGDIVHIFGRIHTQKYTNSKGEESSFTVIKAHSMTHTPQNNECI